MTLQVSRFRFVNGAVHVCLNIGLDSTEKKTIKMCMYYINKEKFYFSVGYILV